MTDEMKSTDLQSMDADALRALAQKLLDERAAKDEAMADLYHPEFGAEWRNDGEIGQAILHAKAEAIRESIALIEPASGASGDVATALTIAARALSARRREVLRLATEGRAKRPAKLAFGAEG